MRKMSPWGKVQNQKELAPGIIFCSTDSHGGIWIDQKHQRKLKIKSKFLQSKTWWEEDIDFAVPFYFFKKEIKKYMDEEIFMKNVQAAKQIVEKHYSEYPELLK